MKGLAQIFLLLVKKISKSIIRILSLDDRWLNKLSQGFTLFYYKLSDKTWKNTNWLGNSTWKCPLDLWIYQEIIYDLKPDIIIESGTYKGGTTLYMAIICDLVNNGKIITIDIRDFEDRPKHNRIKYLTGSSISDEIVKEVKEEISNNDKVLVVLDSNHKTNHVLKELRIYSKLVSKGSYIIVEDTFVKGPKEAIPLFLKHNKNFVIDESKHKFIITFNPNGYLKKVK